MDPALEHGLPLTSTELNSATEEDFRKRLPGVGDVLAKRIVTWREANGRFSSVRDLAGVRGISPRLLEKLSAYVFVAHLSSVRPRSVAPPAPFPISGHPSFSFVPRISSRPVRTVVPKLIEIPMEARVDAVEERFFAVVPEKAASVVAARAKAPSRVKSRIAVLLLCVVGTTVGVAAGLRIEERAPSSRVMILTAQVAESRTRDTELRTELAARAVEWEAKSRALQTAVDEQAAETVKIEEEQVRLERKVTSIVDATKAEETRVYQLGEAVKDIDFFMTLESLHMRPTVVGKKPKAEAH